MNGTQKRIAALLEEAPYMTAPDVAETLGVHLSTVYQTARKFGLKYRRRWVPPTDREKHRIAQLSRAGLSTKEIAKRVQIGRKTVQRIRTSLGYSQRANPMLPLVDRATHMRIVTMHFHEGASYGDIAIALGVTRNVVAGACYRARHRKAGMSIPALAKEVEAA